jgi:threonine synthase
MHYYSLNDPSHKVDFSEAVLRGQAPDKGLYFPAYIPELSKNFLQHIYNLSKDDLAFAIMKPFVGDSIPDDVLRQIVAETVNFDFPLVKVGENIYALELFHGPTLAFKDVGARFMSRCLGYFNRNSDKHTTVLVATSGDTGGAVANGFLGVEGVDVVVLYPSGKVSAIQELQLTTQGQNISALEINGTFDDCQAMVKRAFVDKELLEKFSLTSANSINVGRWLPQQLYYFFAYQQWPHEEPPVISVPSGNFGNICAGMVAYISGLPVKHFIAACNANDVVPEFLETGNYQPKRSVATISNAMDVGDPSNFVRVMELFSHKLENLRSVLTAISVDDDTTRQTIKDVHEKFHYTLDPHGAVGYFALSEYLQESDNGETPEIDGGGIFLETAHPVKFPETVEQTTNSKIKVPASVEPLLARQKQSTKMDASFQQFKEWLMRK